MIPKHGFISSTFGNWRRSSTLTFIVCSKSVKLTSNLFKTRAINVMTSRRARNRPGQSVRPPPKGLKLRFRLRLLSSRNLSGLNCNASMPKASSLKCSWRLGTRTSLPGLRVLPFMSTGLTTVRTEDEEAVIRRTSL